MEYKSPRGTRDILPPESEKWDKLVETITKLANLYSYKKVYFPIFEHTELFTRGIGEDTDIVQKEMYTFQDKKGRWLTLRPEGTAPVARLFVEHNLAHKSGIFKAFYVGSMYRYERPQAGRYREFYQIGVEALGSINPLLDVEVISLGREIMEVSGLKGYKVLVNSIGCPQCRPVYIEQLKKFLENLISEFCFDCKKRYHANPLRILDCKEDKVKLNQAPKTVEYLCSDCSEHYSRVKSGLSELEIPWVEDAFLARGLDYYTKTVFEIVSSHLGENASLLGGGRYDNLVSMLGGPDTPAVGFALGLDRLLEAAMSMDKNIFKGHREGIYVAYGTNSNRDKGMIVSHLLRKENIKVDLEYLNRSIKSQAKNADKEDFKYLLTIFERDMVLRNLETGNETVFEFNEIDRLIRFIRKGEK